MGQLSDPDVHYDRVTAAWQYLIGDDLHLGYFAVPTYSLAEATQALTRLMAERAGITPGMEILDIGCGTGGPAIHLAQTYGCRVVGISTSIVGVERARERGADAGLDGNVRFCVAEGTATGLPSNTFDLVWIMESSHLIPEKELLLRESARLLRSGGKLCLCDIISSRPTPLSEVLKLRQELTTLQSVFGRVKTKPLACYARMLEEIGLSVETEDISEEVLPTLAHWKQNARRHAQTVAELIGKDEVEQFVSACDIMAQFWKDGRFGYGVLVATKPI
jgi:cyclopropane fatty-acyl-phospholipid synthase-like methyltransferase